LGKTLELKSNFRANAPQDSDNAHFGACARPILSLIPLLIGITIGIAIILPDRWMPLSIKSSRDGSRIEQQRPQLFPWTAVLFSIGLMAAVFQGAKVFLTEAPLLHDTLLLASWLPVLLIIGLKRPIAAPSSLLAYYFCGIVIEFSKGVTWTSRPSLGLILRVFIATCCLLSILIIFCMPIRPPVADSERIDVNPGHSAEANPEDSLRLFQFFAVSWIWPLLTAGKQRQLQKADVWTVRSEIRTSRLARVFDSLHQSTVFRKLLHANSLDLIIVSAIAGVQLVLEFSSPILLHQFLYVIAKERSGKQPAVLYSLLLLARGLFASQFYMLGSWYGRRCFERTSGLLSTAIYRQTLLRKNIISSKSQDTQESSNGSSSAQTRPTEANGNGKARSGNPSGAARNDKTTAGSVSPDSTTDVRPGKLALFQELVWGSSKSFVKSSGTASQGQVLNIVRGDVSEIARFFKASSTLIQLPIGLVVAVWLIWDLLGPSCLLGVLVLLVSQVFTLILSRLQMRWRRFEKRAKDDRIHLTSTYIETIRHLRWYAWQDSWLKKVFAVRRHELNVRVVRFCLSFLIYVITTCAGAVFPAVAFIGYTTVGKQRLRTDLIFPALQLFSSLQGRLRELPSLITSIMNFFVAMERVEDFEREPVVDISENYSPLLSRPYISLTHCTFAWPGQLSPALKDVSLSLPEGLSLIHGEIGSGKSGRSFHIMSNAIC
jgi:ABC-type multidrug transport system fused ATPase/permease subunit